MSRSCVTLLCLTGFFWTLQSSSGGELVGSEADRERQYPNIVAPEVVIGGYGASPAQFLDIRDVAFRDGRSFYVAECSSNRIQQFDVNGHLQGVITAECPSNISYSQGHLISFSEQTNKLSVFSDDRDHLFDWTLPFERHGKVGAVAIKDGLVFVIPKRGRSIDVFNVRGELQRTLSAPDLERVADAAVSGEGIFISDRAAAQIVRLDLRDSSVHRFGSYGTYPGELANPHGVDVAAGKLIVADTVNHRIQQFDLAGKFVLQWGRHPVSPHETSHGRMHYPHNVALAPDGNHAVVCEPYESKCNVFKFEKIVSAFRKVDDSAWWNKFFWFHYRSPSRTGKATFFENPADADHIFMGEEDIHRIVVAKIVNGVPETVSYFGEYGSGEGQFKGPEGVFPSPKGELYVVDTNNHRVQVFDFKGNYKRQFGKYGSGPGEFNLPGQGSADKLGNLYISDPGNHRIQVFDKNERHLYDIGQAGTQPGQLLHPIDAFVDDKNDRVLVVDLMGRKVVVYDKAGRFLNEIGKGGTGVGEFLAPHSVVYDEESDSVFVSDMVGDHIQKFASDGRFISRHGRYGIAKGEFKTPAGLSLLNGKLFVMDHTNHRGQIMDVHTGDAIATFGETVIGIPTEMLNAQKRLKALEEQLNAILPGTTAPPHVVESVRKELRDLQIDLSKPSAAR
jgi:tripartite motif-containing protein 71